MLKGIKKRLPSFKKTKTSKQTETYFQNTDVLLQSSGMGHAVPLQPFGTLLTVLTPSSR